MRQHLITATAGLALAAAATAPANFITPDDYGWSRGDTGSTYFAWDVFTSTSGGNEPDVGQFPDPLPVGWIQPDVIDTTGTAFITGSGNIYSPVGPINIEVTVPNYDDGSAATTTLLLQVRTVGNELDYSGVALDGGMLPTEIIELSRQAGDLGFEVETLFVFEVSGNAAAYVFDVPTADAHVSVNAITVDTLASAGDCLADFNDDGAVNTQDVLAFLNAWSSGDSSADINADGTINTQDVLAFLNLWSVGC